MNIINKLITIHQITYDLVVHSNSYDRESKKLFKLYKLNKKTLEHFQTLKARKDPKP